MQSLYLCSAALFVLLASARGADYSLKNPAAEDPRIQKQQPFHWGTPPPGHRVKLGFVPIKVLASVRHEKSTKFVPRREALSDATTPEEIVLAKRLKEAITTKKLGEVYTEQGYEDQKYDHGHFEKQGDFKEQFQNHDIKEHKSEHADSSGDQATHATVDVPATKAAVDVVKYPFYLSAPENSAKRYATNPKLLPDKKNNPDLPFYESTNYKECPDIAPVLSVGPDDKGPKGEPRLRGLGDKIDCLVSKYFGADPFDNPLFKEEKVHAGSINPQTLLPSETNTGPVLFITNASKKEQAEKEARTKKMRQAKQAKKNKQNLIMASAATEEIKGLMPPPLPIRLRKARDIGAPVIYSTRQGGVKFLAESKAADAPHPSRRLSGKFGARSYEVTEEPEEQPLRAFPVRTTKIERHRLNQEEPALYSSTYVPEAAAAPAEEAITTKWNAAPAPRQPENVILAAETPEPPPRPQKAQSRGRARVHAAIPEDIFDGRGERRIRPPAAQTEVQRSRQRIRAPKRVQTTAVDSEVTTVTKYAEPATEAPLPVFESPLNRPIPPPEEKTTEFIAPDKENLDISNILSADPIPAVPETTTNSVAAAPIELEAATTTTTTTTTTTPAATTVASTRGRQRSSSSRSRDRSPEPATKPQRARGRQTEAVAEADDEKVVATTRRTVRRGRQRTKPDEAEKPLRNAPEATESVGAATNQRARPTSPEVPVSSEHRNQEFSRARGRKRFNPPAHLDEQT
ncbi:uncharacterized protein LOC135942782 [Cloeon dipterum]|uniref:uncharacterized protein LOC135942782 n=1 Tax=Cloeon dipterum TaxID=197152 RepID=UPI00321FEC6B